MHANSQTALSAAIQAELALSLGPPCEFSNHMTLLAEVHMGSLRPLRVLHLTPTNRHIRWEWCSVRGNWTVPE
ncbi:hypothetical protein TNCV_159451 [Trichonephila clavipes]|uniref:Uncharacterized protein n=1 Tax=Trichonephila clavipes TaxID=2585209 RepID=A0A8X6R4T8_TRICX|nr:hypothetical protein TNCV_159451 [Trichonephila clavipes]